MSLGKLGVAPQLPCEALPCLLRVLLHIFLAVVGLVSNYLAPFLCSISLIDQGPITLIGGIIQIWNMIVSMIGANLVVVCHAATQREFANSKCHFQGRTREEIALTLDKDV